MITADKMLSAEAIAVMEGDHGRIGHGVMQRNFTLAWQLYPLDDGEERKTFASAHFEIVIRHATAAEVKLYRARTKTAAAATADEELLKQVCVYPTPEVLATIMEPRKGWSMLSGGATKAILRLSGAAIEEDAK